MYTRGDIMRATAAWEDNSPPALRLWPFDAPRWGVRSKKNLRGLPGKFEPSSKEKGIKSSRPGRRDGSGYQARILLRSRHAPLAASRAHGTGPISARKRARKPRRVRLAPTNLLPSRASTDLCNPGTCSI
ncbi:unnamed protein product, partial [Iphiclides podalirius]